MPSLLPRRHHRVDVPPSPDYGFFGSAWPVTGEASAPSRRGTSLSQLGVWFRRQVPLGPFIADLLAPHAHLVVELERGYHRTRRALDARCDARLARLGYRVLGVETSLVRRDIQEALRRICAALAD